MVLWLYIFIRLIREIVLRRIGVKIKLDDPALTIFWFALYLYCLAGLAHLGVLSAKPIYTALCALLSLGTVLLTLINFATNDEDFSKEFQDEEK